MDVASLISNSQNQLNSLNNQVSSSQGALDEFSKNQKSASDFYNNAQNELGVEGARNTQGQAQKALNLTQGLINNLPNSVTGRTQGSLVTEAQRQRLLANELNPLQQQYGSQSQSYNQSQQALQDLLGQASQRAGLNYQSQQDKYGQLRDALSTALSQKDSVQSNLQSLLDWQEKVRQFNEQLAESQRQFQAQQASNRIALSNAQKALQSQQAAQAAQTNNSPSKIYYRNNDPTSEILGYETPTRSYQTDAGWREQQNEINRSQRNLLGQIFGGVGDWTGWF